MARLPVRQEMKMISVFIMHMKMMESKLVVLLLLTIVLAMKKRSARFRRSMSYAYQALSRYNIRPINLNEMVFHSKKATTRNKKGKIDDVLCDLVGEIRKYVTAVTKANEEMKGISTYLKKQTESNDRKMRIYDELMELAGFSQQEIMDAGEYILKDEHKVDNFFALPKAFRRDYVVKQLSEINPYKSSFDF